MLICVVGSPCLRRWILHRLSIGLWLFASCRLFSSTSASFLITWSCRHLSRPGVSAVLQPDRTCWSEALMVPQRLQDCSVPSHLWRFLGLERLSYVALMRKLSRACGSFQNSAQLIARFATPSQVIHRPYCPCATDLTLSSSCSILVTSATTRSFLSFLLALDHRMGGSLQFVDEGVGFCLHLTYC